MTKLHLTALISFVFGHLAIIIQFLIEQGDSDFESLFRLILVWIIGIFIAIPNILLADKIGLNKWLMIIFSLSSILYLIPILIVSYFAIPCVSGFFIIGVYLHIKAIRKMKTQLN
jgi:hypothetical protein